NNFNLTWLENNELFTPELSSTLKFIENNRHQGNKHYVSSNRNVGNIKVTNEIEYNGFDWQDKNLRLLALFRYWNIIEYFFPYKYQTDINWNDVLKNILPKFLSPKTEMDFHLAMLELVVSIDDSHAIFSSEITESFFGKYWIPAAFKLIDDKAVITWLYDDSLAEIDDIKVGDAITKVNGTRVEEVFRKKKKYITGSNISRKKYMAWNAIFNGSNTTVEIEFVRGGKTHIKTIKRHLWKDSNFKKYEVDTHKTLDGNIGYVNMGALKQEDVVEVMASLNNTKAIIFDIRNYPNSTVYEISKYISSKRNDFFKKTYPDLNYPGKFIRKNGRKSSTHDGLKYQGKVILLVNERSQSQAEFTAMCLQTGDRVTTIGSQTSGADGTMSEIVMVGGFKTAISGTGIFYPDGTEAQRKGVKIDIVVRPTIQGIIDGRDEVLEKAIEFINE
uniref:S41 family peptidase n=1 Tax=Fulvivirga sp. TaxID=1931237 RepID=UPI00404A81DA